MSEAPSQQPRNCVSCGRSISWDANVCPYCGHDYRAQVYAGQQRGETISSGVKILFYLLSFFIPIVGFIIGAIYYSKPEPEMKEVGKMCLILAVLAIVVTIVCWGGLFGIGLLAL
jgi:predicted RNA-binding Zn-ribbon protein involved in translation (DUF1610 family)